MASTTSVMSSTTSVARASRVTSSVIAWSSASIGASRRPSAAEPRSTRGPSDDELIGPALPGHDDLTGLLERTDHTDDIALCLFDRLQANRAQEVDLLAEVRGGAGRHVAHDLLAHV